jgi:hypothetical protein
VISIVINPDKLPLWSMILIGIFICSLGLYYLGQWFRKSIYYNFFMSKTNFTDNNSIKVKEILERLDKQNKNRKK